MKVKKIRKQAKISMMAIVMILAVFIATIDSHVVFAQGVDSEGYTLIENAKELDTLVRNNLSGKFRLKNDIDLTGYISNTNTVSKGWTPIAKDGYFKGVFDGNGHTIKGLWSNSGAYTGLFSKAENAYIKNLNIELTVQGMTGNYEVGGVVGYANKATTIENCHVKGGQIIVTGGGYAGGIVGISRGPNGKVLNCTVTDTYTQTSGNYAGGIIGAAYKTSVEGCEAIHTKSTGYSYVGGIAGAIYGQSTIKDSRASAEVSSKGPYVGGLLGVTYEQSSVINCNATGNAISTYAGDAYVGGFAGAIYGKSTVVNSCASGDATATKGQIVGGFAAIAYDSSSITKAIARGNVSSYGNYAGGFLAKLHAGAISIASTVDQVAAYGNVTAKGYVVGGLIGESLNSKVSNTYARGEVTGTTGVGGLVGYFSGSSASGQTVYNSYSSGRVNGKNTSNEYGAFSGYSGVTFIGTNYYDKNTAGVVNSHGTAGNPKGTYPVGYNTATMMKQSTFVGWDFDTIWKIDENTSYPYFDVCNKPQTQDVTITFNSNATDTSGTMDIQKVKKDVPTQLGKNSFQREDYIFLGWSTTPSGDVSYIDEGMISVSQDIILYAVWGTPELYTNTVTDKDQVHVGEIITVTHTVGNENKLHSTTLYNSIMEIYIPEDADYVYNSLKGQLNGTSIYLLHSFDPVTKVITIDLGEIKPGQEFTVTYKSVGLPSSEGIELEFNMKLSGDLTPSGRIMNNALKEITKYSQIKVRVK